MNDATLAGLRRPAERESRPPPNAAAATDTGNESILKKAILPHIKALLKPALKRGEITREKFKTVARHMTKKVCRGPGGREGGGRRRSQSKEEEEREDTSPQPESSRGRLRRESFSPAHPCLAAHLPAFLAHQHNPSTRTVHRLSGSRPCLSPTEWHGLLWKRCSRTRSSPCTACSRDRFFIILRAIRLRLLSFCAPNVLPKLLWLYINQTACFFLEGHCGGVGKQLANFRGRVRLGDDAG